MEYPWIKIEDLSRFTIKELKQYHPDDPRHTEYWRGLKLRCIEGVWGEDFGKLRYMPGRLFFYGHFCSILDVDEDEKKQTIIKPDIRDLEWERSYMYLEAEGFSGWSDDDLYTSEHSIKKIRKNYNSSKVTSNPRYFKSNGDFKEFIPPKENIRMLHDINKGRPLYYNNCSNIMELGSRGGGKSYFYSLAGAKYRITFDGAKVYNEETRRNPGRVTIVIGSGRTDKSSDFAAKIEDSMNLLAIDNKLGAWGKLGDEDYQPSPFFKDMAGSLRPNNKENPWRHSYEMNINGRWIKGFGTGSKIQHVSYSSNKKEGAEAAAGGRYTDVIIEEVGLTEKVIEAYNSNRATVTVGTNQFGVQVFLGTSGNMETIQNTRTMYTNPGDYEILSFPDYWEASGRIGFFLTCIYDSSPI